MRDDIAAGAYDVETMRIATFDERHFRHVRPLHGGEALTLLPVDAGGRVQPRGGGAHRLDRRGGRARALLTLRRGRGARGNAVGRQMGSEPIRARARKS